jgi:hypothetical protein
MVEGVFLLNIECLKLLAVARHIVGLKLACQAGRAGPTFGVVTTYQNTMSSLG